jgi:anti-anti-sigma regulatory factor
MPSPQSAPRPSTGLRALTYTAGDAAVITVEGWLDVAGAPALDAALAHALVHGHRQLVLDLHQLRRVDPDAVGVLQAGLRAVVSRGGTLAAAGLRPSLQPAVEPLVPYGLRLHGTVLGALSARIELQRPTAMSNGRTTPSPREA